MEKTIRRGSERIEFPKRWAPSLENGYRKKVSIRKVQGLICVSLLIFQFRQKSYCHCSIFFQTRSRQFIVWGILLRRNSLLEHFQSRYGTSSTQACTLFLLLLYYFYIYPCHCPLACCNDVFVIVVYICVLVVTLLNGFLSGTARIFFFWDVYYLRCADVPTVS